MERLSRGFGSLPHRGLGGGCLEGGLLARRPGLARCLQTAQRRFCGRRVARTEPRAGRLPHRGPGRRGWLMPLPPQQTNTNQNT